MRDEPRGKQEGDVLTTQETIKLLGVSRPTLYRMMDEGVLTPLPGNPTLLVQKRLYFRREDVERVLREGRKPPSQPSAD
jgi:predicted DNA-binding transcriptional regulator AlpA